jgi:lipoprotein-releasing system ATP-binding protein
VSLLLQNIHKSLFNQGKEINILNDINLCIEKGEMVSLVGQSGAGKSTLLQIAGLLDHQTSGNIYINNAIVSIQKDKIRTEIRKNQIGFIYQSHYLFNEINVIENITIPLLIAGISKKQSVVRAEEILEEVGLIDRKLSFPSQLSGGEKQRVSVARALIKNPSIILADEPTGNLDEKNSDNIFKMIKGLTNQKNISCLFVTHNKSLAKKSDRVVSLKDKRIL